MTKVSVIVPNYNNEKYLERCLTSLQNQTEKDIEFILVDDASTDKSIDIMETYRNKDSRFKIISSSKNEGVSMARNRGIEIATGKYIGFVDSDDYICQNYYASLMEQIKDTSLLVAAGRLYPSLFPYASSKKVVDFKDKKSSLTEGTISVCTHLFERDLIGEDRFLEHSRFEDTAFTLFMHMKSGKIAINNLAKYHYCNDSKNSFNKVEMYSLQSILDTYRVVDFLEMKIEETEKFTPYQEEIKKCKFYLIAGNTERIHKNYEEAQERTDLLNHLSVILENSSGEDTTREYLKRHLPYYIIDSIQSKYQEQYRQMTAADCKELFKTKIKSKIERLQK